MQYFKCETTAGVIFHPCQTQPGLVKTRNITPSRHAKNARSIVSGNGARYYDNPSKHTHASMAIISKHPCLRQRQARTGLSTVVCSCPRPSLNSTYFPRHLGAAVRETSRAKLGTRLSVRQRWAGLGAYVHGFSLGLLTAGIRTIAWYLHRFVCLECFG